MYVILSNGKYLYGLSSYSDDCVFGTKKKKALKYRTIDEAARVVDNYLPRGNYYSIERI